MTPVELDNSPAADALEAPQQSDDQNAQAPSESDDLATKYAASQREAAEWRGRAEARAEENNRLKKAILNDEQPKPSEPKAATTDDLQKVKEEIRWELKHEQQIELADKNGKFTEYVQQGKTKQDALKLALYDEGITNTSAKAENLRQAQAASAPAGPDRSTGDNLTEQEKKDMKLWGFSKETLLNHKRTRKQ